MAVIRQICTHVAILDGGLIAEEGSVDEVFTHTKSQAGRRLFGIIPSDQNEEVPLETPAVRIVFDGEKLLEPVIANLILQLQVPVSILSADVRNLNGVQYGQMLIELNDDPAVRRQAMDYLIGQGLAVEEVHR